MYGMVYRNDCTDFSSSQLGSWPADIVWCMSLSHLLSSVPPFHPSLHSGLPPSPQSVIETANNSVNTLYHSLIFRLSPLGACMEMRYIPHFQLPPSERKSLQWNLRERDTLGKWPMSLVERSSLSWRFVFFFIVSP